MSGPPYAARSVRDRSERVVTCAVNARDFGEVKVAQLSCEGVADDDSLAAELTALYVADLRGVWRTDGAAMPTSIEDARAAISSQTKPLLASTPKTEEERTEDKEEGFGEMRKVSQAADGAWCVEWGSWGGDEGGGSICFAAGTLERLDQKVGRDPSLDSHRASAYLLDPTPANLAEGERLARASVTAVPHIADAWWTLVSVQVARGDHASVATSLDELQRRFDYAFDRDDMAADELYGTFPASPEFEAWWAKQEPAP